MLKNPLDAADGRWLTNKLWVVIIISAIAVTWGVCVCYMGLRAENSNVRNELTVFKTEINTKLGVILEYKQGEKKCRVREQHED